MTQAALRVLVIEDDPVTARWAERALRELGLDADVAHLGDEGLRLAAANPYALVMADVGLPDRSGITVVQELRASGATMPVIVMTADAQDERVVAALDAGADDYLVKPVSARVLQARVRAALRRGGPAGGTNGGGVVPFAGALVPAAHYRRDQRVSALMIEINRGLYMNEETGERLSDFAEVGERVRSATRALLRPIPLLRIDE